MVLTQARDGQAHATRSAVQRQLHDASNSAIAALSRARHSADASTIGKRTLMFARPLSARAALAGAGLASENIALFTANIATCRLPASAKRPASASLTITLTSF